MRWLLAWVAVVLIVAGYSRATTMPALQLASIPDVLVLDEASRPISLRTTLEQAGAGPVILLPIFTRCSASCPTLTRKLEAGLAAMKSAQPYRVVVLSFDPLETAESLRLYRAREQMPSDWKLVRAQENEVRGFLGFFRYSVMNQEGTLVHPSEVFLLDEGLNWRWTLVGEDWTREDLAAVIDQTRSPGFAAWLQAHPERLAWIGLAGAVLGIGVAIGWVVRRKTIGRKPASLPVAT